MTSLHSKSELVFVIVGDSAEVKMNNDLIITQYSGMNFISHNSPIGQSFTCGKKQNAATFDQTLQYSKFSNKIQLAFISGSS